MTDEELVAAFESTQLPGTQFTHEAHVRVAWYYLCHACFTEALDRFSTALRRYAAAQGAAGKYHETITVAYMSIIAERIASSPGPVWTEFIGANTDLLSARTSILNHYYSAERLASDLARREFVPPDRAACRWADVARVNHIA